MTAPRVTVLMPVHDGERWIAGSVATVLAQAGVDFELLAVDDGSTDRTRERLAAFGDPRVRVLPRPRSGLVAALNAGIAAARGAYLARFDADDEMLPGRLARQARYLDTHPAVVACGTDYELFGACTGVVRMPRTPAACRARLAFATCIAHPAAMIRASALRTHGIAYRAEHAPAEDYAFFSALSERGELANLPFVGLRYRVHASQVSSADAAAQRAAVLRIAHDNLRRRGVASDPEALAAMLWLDRRGVGPALAYTLRHAPRLVALAARADARSGAATALQYVREQLNSALRRNSVPSSLGDPNSD